MEQSNLIHTHHQIKVATPTLHPHHIHPPPLQNIMAVLCVSEEEEVVPHITEMMERLEARNRVQKVCVREREVCVCVWVEGREDACICEGRGEEKKAGVVIEGRRDVRGE